MIILDASVLIAHLEIGDGHHDRATALLLDNCNDAFAASAVTVVELLVGAIRAGRGDQARDALNDLQVQSLGVAADAAWGVAEIQVRTSLKLPDCCVLDAARRHSSARLATFDARLAAGARELGVSVIGG